MHTGSSEQKVDPRGGRPAYRRFLVEERDGPGFFIRRPSDHKNYHVLRPAEQNIVEIAGETQSAKVGGYIPL